MSHHCEAALITCEDFRLHQRKDGRNYIAEFIKNLRIDCDLITRAGGVQDLVRPEKEDYCDSLLRDGSVSAKLHAANVIYLVNHEDCGAYVNMHFSSRQEELSQHYDDLHAAKKIILNEFPNKKIELFFGELKPGSRDDFVIKEIS